MLYLITSHSLDDCVGSGGTGVEVCAERVIFADRGFLLICSLTSTTISLRFFPQWYSDP